MKVLYNSETIELKDNLKDGATNYDVFSDSVNLEDTIEFNPDDFLNQIDLARINLENTIKLGAEINE